MTDNPEIPPRMTVLSEQIARRLVSLRKQAGLSREDVVARLNELGWPSLAYGTLGSIETGRPDSNGRIRTIAVDELAIFAKLWDIPPGDFFLANGGVCPVCFNAPPVGFTCNDCGATGKVTDEA